MPAADLWREGGLCTPVLPSGLLAGISMAGRGPHSCCSFTTSSQAALPTDQHSKGCGMFLSQATRQGRGGWGPQALQQRGMGQEVVCVAT